jgi:TPR repeat protein
MERKTGAARLLLAALFTCAACAACVVAGCKTSSQDPGEGASDKGPPPITIANTMGTCDDLDRCARECNAGQGDSCRRLAVTYEFGKSDAGRNEALGTSYFDRSCALGNAAGCVSSGQMHEYAHGVPKDFPEAAAAYARACTLGWQVGCANWAIMLENGRGVPRDLQKAKSLYDDACKAGAGLACDRLKVLAGPKPADAG